MSNWECCYNPDHAEARALNSTGEKEGEHPEIREGKGACLIFNSGVCLGEEMFVSAVQDVSVIFPL